MASCEVNRRGGVADVEGTTNHQSVKRKITRYQVLLRLYSAVRTRSRDDNGKRSRKTGASQLTNPPADPSQTRPNIAEDSNRKLQSINFGHDNENHPHRRKHTDLRRFIRRHRNTIGHQHISTGERNGGK